ncbi:MULTISPECIES: fe2+ zn2+ uptake regulation protein [Pseudomonas]|uniref:fe2+ zn2+ uptake regulation protein n=1 Tax=Pseudomonas TaxID=286 RepID=UPI001BE5A054|nr:MULTISPECIES: fe2+ zn2+ uptake regulation protein [Pseudomonas]MBT2339784.1 fe2+ zn2+ uptake regulation protein [Pseudomonas fluorescens]MCD4528570.1 fe2+ zn2+ uptake regulation protein [Pseudomonas sp. C3-2018]
MRNAQRFVEGKPRSTGVSLGGSHIAFGRPTERGGNEHIRRLLKSFGLRTSLIRLKVIDALLKAAGENQCLGVRDVHSQLLGLDIPSSFLSVREVLKRLCSEGVVVLDADKRYRLHPTAMAVIEAGE